MPVAIPQRRPPFACGTVGTMSPDNQHATCAILTCSAQRPLLNADIHQAPSTIARLKPGIDSMTFAALPASVVDEYIGPLVYLNPFGLLPGERQ